MVVEDIPLPNIGAWVNNPSMHLLIVLNYFALPLIPNITWREQIPDPQDNLRFKVDPLHMQRYLRVFLRAGAKSVLNQSTVLCQENIGLVGDCGLVFWFVVILHVNNTY